MSGTFSISSETFSSHAVFRIRNFGRFHEIETGDAGGLVSEAKLIEGTPYLW